MHLGDQFSADVWKTLQEGKKSTTFSAQSAQSDKRSHYVTVLQDQEVLYIQSAGIGTELFQIDLNTLSLQYWKKRGNYYHSTHLTEVNKSAFLHSTQIEEPLSSSKEEDTIERIICQIEEEFRNLDEERRNLQISISEMQSSSSSDESHTSPRLSESCLQMSVIERSIQDARCLLSQTSQSSQSLGLSSPGFYSTPGKMDDISSSTGNLQYQLRQMKQRADNLHYDNEKLQSSLRHQIKDCEQLMDALRREQQKIDILKRERRLDQKKYKELQHQLSRNDDEKTKLMKKVNDLENDVKMKERANSHLRSIIQNSPSRSG